MSAFGPHRVFRGFASSESGSLAVFSVFVFVAMLLVGGLAVDVMRHEHERLRMQGTTDRAVLAATMLRETVSNASPEQIVEAYFAAEGLTAQLSGRVQVTEDDETGRTVTVVPAGTVPSLFMSLLGVPDFPLATAARAHEAASGRPQVELVMVLDISGSMGGQNKIGAMRDAASELARTLLTDNDDGSIAITIVPYDAWVLPPPGFLNGFGAISGSGACNDWAIWNQVNNSVNMASWRVSCNTAAWAQVMPFQHDADTVVNIINGLSARGTTSIDLGVRHGALFFDPTIQPALSTLVDNGLVAEMFRQRPLDWDEENVVRALILLTDGENCCGQRYSRALQDANTLSVCSELKARDVLIYAIAFQAPTNGANLMRGCASSPSHFFNADISEIMSVFQGIGANIQTQALRLTL